MKNSFLNKIIRVIKKPSKIILLLAGKNIIKMDDVNYLKLRYKCTFNKELKINNPKTFNEKLQWLKINDRNENYIKMVDKYEAKKYVSSIIGEEYIIPTIGIYNSFDEIDFDKLPAQFVIKCTHDSGGLVICKDKSKLDINKARKKINNCLKRNYFYSGREWPYKFVKPRIIIEKYMHSRKKQDLEDYKVHNFNGDPKFILVCKDRYEKTGLTEDFFDIDWSHLDIKRPNHSNSMTKIPQPSQLSEIIRLSKKLSNDIPFIRTDFYIIDKHIYFGELTLYPASGFVGFCPDDWDEKIGQWLDISNVKK